nr:transposase [Bacillus subtilis]WGE01884.1 transposase [Bacillus subtilis]
MELISGEAGVYGYRKLCLRLRSEYALQINKKKVYRLCKELDILQPQREVKFHYPRKLAITGSSLNRISCGKQILNTATSKVKSVSSLFYRSLMYMTVPSLIIILVYIVPDTTLANSCSVPCLSVSNLKEKQSQSFERIMVHNLFL